MGVLNILELVVNYAQYISISTSINIDFPVSWQPILKYLSFLRFDFLADFPAINIPPMDPRAQFLVLSNVVPLALALLLLIFFKKPRVVLWYCLLLSSLGSLGVGLVVLLLPTNPILGSVKSSSYVFIALGSGFLGICLLVLAVQHLRARRRKLRKVHPRNEASEQGGPQPVLEVHMEEEEEEEDDDDADLSNVDIAAITKRMSVKEKGFWLMTRNVVISGSLILFGLMATRIIRLDFITAYIPEWSIVERDIGALGMAVGIPFISVGGVLFLNIFLNLFGWGRKFLTHLNRFWRKNVLKITLITLSFFYIPVSSSALGMIKCSYVTCAGGQRFYTTESSPTLEFLASSFVKSNSTAICVDCSFEHTCPIAASLCPGETDFRLQNDQTYSCFKEIYPFYGPGAFMSFACLTIGIPYLYYKLISVSSKYLAEIPVKKGTGKEMWRKRTFFSRSSCRSLYSAFAVRWRYYKLFLIIQKLLVVMLFIFAGDAPFALVAAIVAMYFLFMCGAIYSRPYISRIEDAVSISCCFGAFACAMVSFLISFRETYPTVFPWEIPEWVIYPLASLAIGLPVLSVMAMYILKERRRSKSEQEVKEMELATAAQMARPQKSYAMDGAGQMVLQDIEEPNGRKAIVTPQESKKAAGIIDIKLNQITLKTIVNFFLLLGLTSFLSICSAMIGIFYQTTSSNFIDYSMNKTNLAAVEQVRSFEFAGYQDWTAFTENCCCKKPDSALLKSSNDVYELWLCKNTNEGQTETITKLRRRTSGSLNGLSLRPFCSRTFDASVVGGAPTYDAAKTENNFRVVSALTSEEAVLQHLW